LAVYFPVSLGVHFEPKGLNLNETAAKIETGRKKSPSRELGLGLGLLIFETKTHPVDPSI